MRDAGKAMSEMNREYEKWAASHDREDRKIADSVKDTIRDLKSEADVQEAILKKKKEQGQISELTYERESRAIKERELKGEIKEIKGAQGMAEFKLGEAVRERLQQKRAADDSTLPKQISETGQMIAKVTKDLEGAKLVQKAVGEKGEAPEGVAEFLFGGHLGEYMKQALLYGKKLGDNQAGAAESVKHYEKSLEELTLKQQDLTDQWNERKDKLKESQKTEDEWRESVRGYKDALKDAKTRLRTETSKPTETTQPDERNKATIEELAKSGQWMHWTWGNRPDFWQQGPFAAAARQVQWLENTAHNATMWGNTDLAKNAQGRADLLRAQLEKAGVLKKDSSDYVKQIAEKLSGSDANPVAVKVSMTQ
jgi:hypothetical protein